MKRTRMIVPVWIQEAAGRALQVADALDELLVYKAQIESIYPDPQELDDISYCWFRIHEIAKHLSDLTDEYQRPKKR